MPENCNTCYENKNPLEGWWCNQWINEPDICRHHTGTFGEQLRSAEQNGPKPKSNAYVDGLKEKLAIAEAALKPFSEIHSDLMCDSIDGDYVSVEWDVAGSEMPMGATVDADVFGMAYEAYNKLKESNERKD